MSALDVDSQALSGLGRVGNRTAGQSGQEQKDDGLFGALMSGLDSAGEMPRENTRAGGAEGTAVFGQEPTEATPEGGRPLFRREFLASLYAGDTRASEDHATRLAVEAQQAEGEAADGMKADAEDRPVRHRHGARGENGLRASLAAGGEAVRTQTAETAEGTLEAEGEDALETRSETVPDAAALRASADLPTVPVPPAQANGAGAPAEDAPAETARETAAEGALAGALAAGGEADDAPDTIRITVLARETHFAPVKRGSGAEAPAFQLPGAPASDASEPTGTDGSGRGVETGEGAKAGAKTGATDRAAARMDAERAEARLAARQDQAETSAEPEVAAVATAEAEASATGTTGTANGLQQGLTLSNLRQVSSAIGAELARMASPAAAGAQEAQRPAGGPLRLLDIQLHPADLGSITVRMRMGDAGLEVRLSADNPDTARMLRGDQAKLADMLAAEGVEDARVSVVDAGDQAAAWTRFETLPRQAAMQFADDRGAEGGGSEPGSGGRNERKGHDEGEASSGGDRSGRDER